MFEKPPIIEVKRETEPAYDDRWYDRYAKVAGFDYLTFLTGEKEYDLDKKIPAAGPLEKQKEAFLNGQMENPDLEYPNLEKFDSQKIELGLLALKEEISRQETNEMVRSAYLWKINERIATARMLQAAKEKDDRRFARYSRFIFGTPDESVFDYTLFELSKKIERSSHSDNPLIRQIAERLNMELLREKTLQHHENIAYAEATSNLDLVPDEENPHQFPSALAKKPEAKRKERELTAEEIVIAFEEAINKEYKLKGWKVVLNDTASAINVSGLKKTVTVPENRRLPESAIVGLIRHEIGTHARRREQGERSKLKLLGLGLDRYGDDEGVATYEQQKVQGAEDYAGFGGYLAIALAMGIDGKKRNFREVFEILQNYNLMIGKRPEDAKNSAWGDAFRTFRGTTGKTRGACFTKDLLYRRGNIGVWHLIKEGSAEERRFMVGKYDPANPRHIWILDQLGITDKELEALEKE